MNKNELHSPQFKTNKAALEHFTKEYENMGGDKFLLDAENADLLTETHCKIMWLSRAIQMCKYLIGKGNE